MNTAWVVGSHGLLGRALSRSLKACGSRLFQPSRRLEWQDVDGMHVQMARAVTEFAAAVDGTGPWAIHWAAGVGTLQATRQSMSPETVAFAALLTHLEAAPALLRPGGSVALASSAGSIYAASTDSLITEFSTAAPTTAYAYAKLEQERTLADFAARHICISALSARLATLYGPGQSEGKSQGLVTHMARCIVRNQAINIFVPLDTIRDYIAVDDAAMAMVKALAAAPPRCCTTKIVASERATTISEIVAVFKRISRRPPRIVTSASRVSALYTRRVEFRSSVAPDTAAACKLNLAVGISQVLQAERARYVNPGALND